MPSYSEYKYGVSLASYKIAHKDKVPSDGRDVTALIATTHGCGTAISLLELFAHTQTVTRASVMSQRMPTERGNGDEK